MRILDLKEDPAAIASLAARRGEEDPSIEARVREIIDRVHRGGDEALLSNARELDTPGLELAGLRVTPEEIAAARKEVSREFLAALRAARKNIAAYHRRQLPRSWRARVNGVRLEQRYRPVRRAGIYVPGGKAAYPSTVLMNSIPARIAGVEEIAIITPADREGKIRPEVLVAAAECGVGEIYRVGGAHGIAALAYGTASIPAVDKITGPGNAYVAMAKRLLFGVVGIDMVAGPTEVVIVADGGANPAYLAADMIAQAEHDELASAILISTELRLLKAADRELERQLAAAPRRAIAGTSLRDHGALVLTGSLSQAADIVNRLAPEHLEVVLRKPKPFLAKITNAGAIFVGEWSTEALGDYILGPNHTLPTLSTARFSSALGVHDFFRFSNIIEVSRPGFARLARHAEVLAMSEGLYGHAASISIRRGE